jgi:hypothetical protein
MFRKVPLSTIKSYPLYAQQWYMSYRFVDSFRAAGSGGNCVPSWSCCCCSKAVCMTYIIADCTVNNSWWWTEELSETCRFSFQNKFEKLVRLVGFIIRKSVTMHGHMNVIFVTVVTRHLLMYITEAVMSVNSKARGTSGCKLCRVSRPAPCRCTHSRHGSYNFV